MPSYTITPDSDCYVNGNLVKAGESLEIKSEFPWGDPPVIEVLDAPPDQVSDRHARKYQGHHLMCDALVGGQCDCGSDSDKRET